MNLISLLTASSIAQAAEQRRTETPPTIAVQQIPPAIPALPINAETGAVVGGGTLGLIFTLLFLRRKIFRDKLENIKDGSEGLMLKTAIEDRVRAQDDAREAWTDKATDARLIGQLTAENEYLKRELATAQGQVAAIRAGVQSVGRTVDQAQESLSKVTKKMDTGFSSLEDTTP